MFYWNYTKLPSQSRYNFNCKLFLFCKFITTIFIVVFSASTSYAEINIDKGKLVQFRRGNFKNNERGDEFELGTKLEFVTNKYHHDSRLYMQNGNYVDESDIVSVLSKIPECDEALKEFDRHMKISKRRIIGCYAFCTNLVFGAIPFIVASNRSRRRAILALDKAVEIYNESQFSNKNNKMAIDSLSCLLYVYVLPIRFKNGVDISLDSTANEEVMSDILEALEDPIDEASNNTMKIKVTNAEQMNRLTCPATVINMHVKEFEINQEEDKFTARISMGVEIKKLGLNSSDAPKRINISANGEYESNNKQELFLDAIEEIEDLLEDRLFESDFLRDL